MALDETPTACPLSGLRELLAWTEGPVENVAQVAFEPGIESGTLPDRPRSQNAVAEKGRPRLLVCHDLQGGYKDDRWLEGGANPDAYRIWHWRIIDVFVYFSHHLVTIPPACWTNTAHRNGVKVLGTFITEWDEGAATCQEILSSVEGAQRVVNQLAAIAAFHKFDGWLLNIENEIEPAQIPTLVGFVKYLTERMHQVQPGSEVIWYDSVTTEGKLDWQNGLTPLNEPFFAAADGLFVNYTWKAERPSECVKAAGSRAADVFMGVDVFGRGTFGGGKYNAGKGLSAARTAGLSAAIFAPGWVMECPGEAGSNFEHAQEKFWGLINDCWPATWPIVRALPFQTDFNQGVGNSLWSDGALVSDRPWNNLSLQALQPLHHHAQLRSFKRGTLLQARISFDCAFSGGSSYKICGLLADGDAAAVRLFDCGVELLPAQSLLVSFTVSALPGCLVALLLRIELAGGGFVTAVCDTPSWQGNLTSQRRSSNRTVPGKQEAKEAEIGSPVEAPVQIEVQRTWDEKGEEGSSGYLDGRASGSISGLDQKAEQSEATALQAVGSSSLLWADRLGLKDHAGWQKQEYKVELANLADVGQLTDVGVFLHRGNDEYLRSERLWELMKENTEDAWRHQEWEGLAAHYASEGEGVGNNVDENSMSERRDEDILRTSLGRKMLKESLEAEGNKRVTPLAYRSAHHTTTESLLDGSYFSSHVGQLTMQLEGPAS